MSARRRKDTHPDSLDALSSACYTIPWQPRKRVRKTASTADNDPSELSFPILREYETDGVPARVRYISYQLAVQQIERLFDDCISHIFRPLFDDLRRFFVASSSVSVEKDISYLPPTQEPDFFLPGLGTNQAPASTSTRAGNSIRTALLISASAPWLSSFSSRLVSHIAVGSSDLQDSIVVTLSSSECSNLYTALRLLVARFIAQASVLVSEEAEQDSILAGIEATARSGKIEPDLRLLRNWWNARFAHASYRPGIVLNLPAIESIEPTVFSDLLSSLQAFIAEPLASEDHAASMHSPPLTLILGITSPSGGIQAASGSGISSSSAPAPWIDYIPRQVLRVLDISRFSLPSKEMVWSHFVQSFLVSRQMPLALGPSTFEYIRQTYWEKDADLDSILDAIRLAAFIHFSGQPESIFTMPGQSQQVRFSSWTPKMIDQIRLAFLTTDEQDDGLLLPLLLGEKAKTPVEFDTDQFLQQVMQSDQFLMSRMDQLRYTREVLSFRTELAVRFLYRAFEALQKIQSKAASAAQAIQARSSKASIAAAHQASVELDEQRQIEKASEILTQVVSQCLTASVGTLNRAKPPPHALLLSSGLARLCNAARRLLSDEFETLLDDLVAVAEEEVRKMEETVTGLVDDSNGSDEGQIRTSSHIILAQSEEFLAGLRTFQQRLAQTIVADKAGMDEEGDEDMMVTNAANGDAGTAAQRKREARLLRVQRKLLMEEKLLGMKREITDWIVQSVTDLVDWRKLTPQRNCHSLHLLAKVYWMDCYVPLSTLLDPSTRTGMTLALSEPVEFVDSLYDAALSVVPAEELSEIDVLSTLRSAEIPDICRIYQLYRECGKFVNLADWFEAFRQSVELDQALRSVDHDLQQESAARVAQRQASAAVETNGNGAPIRDSRRSSDDDHAGGGGAGSKPRHGRNGQGASDDEEDKEEDGDGDFGVDDGKGESGTFTPSTPSRRRSGRRSVSKRPNLAESSTSDSDEMPETPSKRPKTNRLGKISTRPSAPVDEASTEKLQCRFALALNELARMGMLRGTKRRQEHITKIMWDLVPETF